MLQLGVFLYNMLHLSARTHTHSSFAPMSSASAEKSPSKGCIFTSLHTPVIRRRIVGKLMPTRNDCNFNEVNAPLKYSSARCCSQRTQCRLPRAQVI